MQNGLMHGFGFQTLALLTAVGFAGPLLAAVPRLRIPVLIGELIAGRYIQPYRQDIGFLTVRFFSGRICV